jgi:phosphatidate cytidylyltransferase
MVVVAGTALWLGGYPWVVFVSLVAALVLFEWRRLVRSFAAAWPSALLWNLAGILYIGFGAATLLVLRELPGGFAVVSAIVIAVIATDIGAYFAGRSIGGPKIAPRISPSKTWAGLGGGIVLATGTLAVLAALMGAGAVAPRTVATFAAAGAVAAVVAQAGDFFESWMKRAAGVKDSSALIPGHGGVFDRVDGLLSVSFVAGLFYIFAELTAQRL